MYIIFITLTCAIPLIFRDVYYYKGHVNINDDIDKIKYNMSRKEVHQILGKGIIIGDSEYYIKYKIGHYRNKRYKYTKLKIKYHNDHVEDYQLIFSKTP